MTESSLKQVAEKASDSPPVCNSVKPQNPLASRIQ